jgi:hypothetical protein
MRRERWFDEIDAWFGDQDNENRERARQVDSSPLDKNLWVEGATNVNAILAVRRAFKLLEAGESFRVITSTKAMAEMIRFGVETMSGRRVDRGLAVHVESWERGVIEPGSISAPEFNRLLILENEGKPRFFVDSSMKPGSNSWLSLEREHGVRFHPCSERVFKALSLHWHWSPFEEHPCTAEPFREVVATGDVDPTAFLHRPWATLSRQWEERDTISNMIIICPEEFTRVDPDCTEFAINEYRKFILPRAKNFSLFIDRLSRERDRPSFLRDELVFNRFYFAISRAFPTGLSCYASRGDEMRFILDKIREEKLEDAMIVAPNNELGALTLEFLNQEDFTDKKANVQFHAGGWLHFRFDDPSLPFITTYNRANGLSFENVFIPFMSKRPAFEVMAIASCATRQLFITTNKYDFEQSSPRLHGC